MIRTSLAVLAGVAGLFLGPANFGGVQVRHSDQLAPEDVATLLDMLGLEAHTFEFQGGQGSARINVVIEEYIDGELTDTDDLWGDIEQTGLALLKDDLLLSSEPSPLKLFAHHESGSPVTLRVQMGRLTHNRISEGPSSEVSAVSGFEFHVAQGIAAGGEAALKPGARTAIAAYTLPYFDEALGAYRFCFFDPDMTTWGERFGVPHYFVVYVELLER